jgi:hypothetical protein
MKTKALTGTALAFAALVVALLLTTGALATSRALSPGEFVISGDVKHKVVFSTGQLASLPNQQSETVQFIGPGGLQTHVEKGPLLWDVLNSVVEPDWVGSSLKNADLRYFAEAISTRRSSPSARSIRSSATSLSCSRSTKTGSRSPSLG